MAQLKSIQRAFELIDLLWQMDGGTPSEFAHRLEIPISTAHDYLQSLEATDYVVKEGGRYQLSYGFLSMGSRLQRRNKLYHVAKPEVRTLAEETGEIANVSVEEGDQWILLHDESGYRGLNLGIYPGLKTPLHTHAAGKVILAHLPAGRRSALIDRELEQMTSYTITDGTALKSELSTCRKRGYAIDTNEQVVGMGVVASPLLDSETILGAVAVVCPSSRLTDEDYRKELVRKTRESADSIVINYQYGR